MTCAFSPEIIIHFWSPLNTQLSVYRYLLTIFALPYMKSVTSRVGHLRTLFDHFVAVKSHLSDLLEGHAEPSMNIHLQLPQTQSTLLTGKFYRIYGFFLFSQTLLKMLYWKNKQKLSECENNSK